PVRDSYKTGKPIPWVRVNDLPDFVYFDHSIHVAKGVACITCHGPVGDMPLMRKEHTLQMQWCLECHRNPEKYIGPVAQVFNPDPSPQARQKDIQEWLVRTNHVKKMTTCSTCHR